MYPIIIIFGRVIGVYALFSIAGLLASAFFAAGLAKKEGIVNEDIILLTIFSSIGILIGGHLLYAITNINKIIFVISQNSGLKLFALLKSILPYFSGSVFYGGLAGALIAVYISSSVISGGSKKKELFNIFIVSIPLFHCFGRLGCFFGGCCYGIEASFGFTATGNILNPNINGVSRFPIALFEAAGNLIIWLFLKKLWKNENIKYRLLPIYISCYAPMRFFAEFLRGDIERGIYFGLSVSQWISLALIAAIITYWTLKRIKNKFRF